jgi:hypothetical protein
LLAGAASQLPPPSKLSAGGPQRRSGPDRRCGPQTRRRGRPPLRAAGRERLEARRQHTQRHLAAEAGVIVSGPVVAAAAVPVESTAAEAVNRRASGLLLQPRLLLALHDQVDHVRGGRRWGPLLLLLLLLLGRLLLGRLARRRVCVRPCRRLLRRLPRPLRPLQQLLP